MAELQLRSLTADDRAAVNYLDELAFGFTREPDEEHVAHLDVMTNEYAIGVFDETELVGCGGAFPLDVTVPGGASLPCPGITMIAVKPTHRRRGALSTMMRDPSGQSFEARSTISVLPCSANPIFSLKCVCPSAACRGINRSRSSALIDVVWRVISVIVASRAAKPS